MFRTGKTTYSSCSHSDRFLVPAVKIHKIESIFELPVLAENRGVAGGWKGQKKRPSQEIRETSEFSRGQQQGCA